MRYERATIENTDTIYDIVQNTIKAIYPKYYPREVVDFFCNLHNKNEILKDINEERVGIIVVDNEIVGTGSYRDNHITRVYVKPEYQGRGYGSYIMHSIEKIIAMNYDRAYLDASLPASAMYEHRGYETIKHEEWKCENNVVLVYEIMEKRLPSKQSGINYDGKCFTSKMNTENGEVDSQTIFTYHQDGNILWAEYSGGEIVKGYLLGEVLENGELSFNYQHINDKLQVRIGKCHSIPKVLKDGKIELHEEWQWLNGDMSSGKSVIVELDNYCGVVK